MSCFFERATSSISPAQPLTHEVLGPELLQSDQRQPAGVGVVAVHALLVAMHQLEQRALVVHVGCGHHGAVGLSGAVFHADVHLHVHSKNSATPSSIYATY